MPVHGTHVDSISGFVARLQHQILSLGHRLKIIERGREIGPRARWTLIEPREIHPAGTMADLLIGHGLAPDDTTIMPAAAAKLGDIYSFRIVALITGRNESAASISFGTREAIFVSFPIRLLTDLIDAFYELEVRLTIATPDTANLTCRANGFIAGQVYAHGTAARSVPFAISRANAFIATYESSNVATFKIVEMSFRQI
jgi:hypothetical protein